MIILNKKVNKINNIQPNLTISLTAEERQKVKQTIKNNSSFDQEYSLIKLDLERGLMLQCGDILTNEQEDFFVEIKAKLEPVITVTAESTFKLLKAAYHLGNRHVNLEIGKNYLRLSPDHVLESMLKKMGLNIKDELAPFSPEMGAYKH